MNDMPEISFVGDSLLMAGTPEQRALIALSLIDVSRSRSILDHLFSSTLNWPWIIMQAMHHRTISLLWENLKCADLVGAASKSGLTKNWIAYSEQLSRASLKRNTIWLEKLEWVSDAFNKVGLETVSIKGSALIGDIYTPRTRMLGDIDTLARADDRKAIRDTLFGLGFQHGVVDFVTYTIKPMSREELLFWRMNSHIMPKFTLPLDDPDCPLLRLAVGFDFFDPGDAHHYQSEKVIAHRISKGAGSNIYVPDATDTVINLCSHIFREGTSATIGFVGENWNLWKFCDLYTKLLQLDIEVTSPVLMPRLAEARLEKPFWYALHYTYRVYGDPALLPWMALCDPGKDLSFLEVIADGDRVSRHDRPFSQRLFETGRTELPEIRTVWSNVMKDSGWW